MKDLLLNRKLGAFELLVILSGVALFIGSRLTLFAFVGLTVLFAYSKHRFGGEFSARDLIGLWKKTKEE